MSVFKTGAQWRCSGCGRVAAWSDTWSYFGAMGCRTCGQEPVIKFVACSDTCRAQLERASAGGGEGMKSRGDSAGKRHVKLSSPVKVIPCKSGDTTDLDVLDRASDIQRRGFECDDCGHRHSGAAVGFICIGCPCPRITPKGLAL